MSTILVCMTNTKDDCPTLTIGPLSGFTIGPLSGFTPGFALSPPHPVLKPFFDNVHHAFMSIQDQMSRNMVYVETEAKVFCVNWSMVSRQQPYTRIRTWQFCKEWYVPSTVWGQIGISLMMLTSGSCSVVIHSLFSCQSHWSPSKLIQVNCMYVRVNPDLYSNSVNETTSNISCSWICLIPKGFHVPPEMRPPDTWICPTH